MSKPRLRVFAGPNGSGKSTLFEAFSKKYNTGVFINADIIENELKIKGYIDLNEYNLVLNQEDLDSFLKTENAQSLMKKSIDDHRNIFFELRENIIVDTDKNTHSYEGALISSFIRHHLQKNKTSFCFETVMSHPSKIKELIDANEKGYKTYLYFICIDDPEVNESRVENRVKKGGHDVSTDKISSRYYNTLNHLIKMIENVDKCYFFDNSSEAFQLIAYIESNQLSIEVEPIDLPNWFIEYVLKHYL